MTMLIVIILLSELIALWCAVGLWRSRASVKRKLLWTMVLLVPFFGPVFYGGMFELPAVREDGYGTDNRPDDYHTFDRPGGAPD